MGTQTRGWGSQTSVKVPPWEVPHLGGGLRPCPGACPDAPREQSLLLPSALGKERGLPASLLLP